MPHYKDGKEAKVGDRCRFKLYDVPAHVQGIVVSVSPQAQTCNALVAYPVLMPAVPGHNQVPVVTLTTAWVTLGEADQVVPAGAG